VNIQDSAQAFMDMAAEGATLYTLEDWLETQAYLSRLRLPGRPLVLSGSVSATRQNSSDPHKVNSLATSAKRQCYSLQVVFATPFPWRG
jgi:hypothetical protein